ncbi:MAG: hypothetical protein HFH45_03430 [Bacilli bacterium]|nr:hypothetical protein [Bacilli bacterium]
MPYKTLINSNIEKLKEMKERGEVVPGCADCLFKTLLQQDELKGILVYMIGEITGIDKTYIDKNLRFVNTELPKDKYLEKGKITDLLIDIEDNRINLEMNGVLDEGTLNKGNSYHHRLAAKSLYKAENYTEIKSIIQICFNKKDKLNKFGNESIVEFKMRSKDGKYCLDETFINYQINLEEITNKYYNKKEEINRLEKILLLLTIDKEKELEKVSKGDKELKVMKERIIDFSEDPLLVGLYDEEKAREKVNQVNIEAAEKKGAEQKQIEIAKNMLGKNMDIETISDITALTKEEIVNLKKQKDVNQF